VTLGTKMDMEQLASLFEAGKIELCEDHGDFMVTLGRDQGGDRFLAIHGGPAGIALRLEVARPHQAEGSSLGNLSLTTCT
jgi:hypothetical protein